jgi:hypothetical protein
VEHAEDLAVRVERLEQTNRRLVLVLVAVGSIVAGVGGGWIVRGQRSPPGEVRASRVVLVDPRGRERAVLTMYPDGPQLSLLDSQGRARAGLGADDTGGRLDLLDDEGIPQAVLVGRPGGSAGLTLYDERGPRASLAALSDGAASLGLLASDGQPRLTAMVLPGNDPAMRLRGKGGDLGLGVPPRGVPRIEITDGDGDLLHEAPVSDRPFGHPGRVRPVWAAVIRVGE